MNDEQNNHTPVQENPKNCPNLYASLAATQGALSNPKNDTEGYNYKYATLDQIIDIIRPVMSSNGLCYIQNPIPSVDGYVSVETTIGHESGESISSILTMPIVENGRNNNAQNFGGTLTYIRRYALSSALGICSEDDNDAAGQNPKTVAPKPQPKKPLVVDIDIEKYRTQVIARIETTGIAEMCAANGFNPKTAELKTCKAFLAQSDESIAKKLAKFNKQQEKEVA